MLMVLFPKQAMALTPTPAPTFTPTGTAAGPDLVVTRMAIASRTTGCPQGPLGLLVTVANVGAASAGSFSVMANSNPAQTVSGLAPGASVTLWFSGYTYGSANTATADVTNQVAESNEANNTLSQMVPIPTPLYCPTVTPGTPTYTPTPVTGRPDLVITRMAIASRTTGCPQGPLGLRVTVTNLGTAGAGPFTVTANSNPPQTLPGLGPGASVTLWFSAFVTFSPNTATADAANQVAESNESNNTLSQILPIPTPLYCPTVTPGTPSPTYTPTPTRTPTITPTGTVGGADLIVTRMAIASRTTGCPQGSLGLFVTVANIGSGAAGSFVVTTNSNQAQIVSGLAPAASVTLWFSSFITFSPNTATADATNQVAESNEGNNTLSQMVPIPTPLYCPTATPGTPTTTLVATP